jgi:phosphonate transport system substrate-binding protein
MQPRTRTSRSIVLAMLSVFALLAAACGDDDQTSTGDTTAEASPAAAPAGDDDSGDDGIDRSDWPDKLVLAAVPAEQDAQLQESYSVTVQILEDELGIPVETSSRRPTTPVSSRR